jgi:hypothetical protein
VQVCPPVEVIRTVVADTAPVELVEPDAVTQSPTARSAAAALWSSWYLVDEEMSTVTGVVVGVVVEVDVLGREPKSAEEKPSTTMVLAPTEVTFPLAKPKFPDPKRPPPAPPPAPEGGRRVPPPGKVPPFAVEPDARVRPGKAPAVHEPDAAGCVIDTVCAVMVPLLDEPLTVTQSPTATDFTATVFENVVEDVQLTVT